MDALGSAIRIDTRGREVMRILPRINDDMNEEWISDKTRYVVDGLSTQRLDRPYVRDDGKLAAGDAGREAFAAIAAKVKATAADAIGAIAGDLAAVEEMFALKELMTALGSPNIDCRQDGAASIRRAAAPAICSTPTIAGIEQADAILIIGANPRLEAPVLNARIRKRWRARQFPDRRDRRAGRSDLPLRLSRRRPARRSRDLGQTQVRAKRSRQRSSRCSSSAQGALARPDGAAVLALAAKAARRVGVVKDGWNGFAVLHTAASRVGGLDLGFVPGEGGTTRRADGGGRRSTCCSSSAPTRSTSRPGAFVVYIGTHGDRGAHRADVILPGAAYTEKSGIYVNTEGRVQLAEPRRVPAGRGARGLGDPARAVGRARRASCRSTRSSGLRAGAVRGASAFACAST